MRLNCTYKISSDGKFYVFLFLITMKKAMNFLTQEKKVNERFGTINLVWLPTWSWRLVPRSTMPFITKSSNHPSILSELPSSFSTVGDALIVAFALGFCRIAFLLLYTSLLLVSVYSSRLSVTPFSCSSLFSDDAIWSYGLNIVYKTTKLMYPGQVLFKNMRTI